MNYFTYRENRLFAEDVAVEELARRLGTPLYIYSARTLRRHYRVLSDALKGSDSLICFAMKALSNLSVLKLFSDMGSGFDIVSVGELMRCLRAGADPRKIVFSGVGKTDEEIEAALRAGILMINVESRPELDRISEVARRMGRPAPVSLRVNPDLDPGTHPHISTGHRDSKFGVPLSQVREYYAEASRVIRVKAALASGNRRIDPNVVDAETAANTFKLDTDSRDRLRRLFEQNDEWQYSGTHNGPGRISPESRRDVLELIENLRA